MRSPSPPSSFLLVSIQRSTKFVYALLKPFSEPHSVPVKDASVLLLALADPSYKSSPGYSYNYSTPLLY